MSINFAGAAVSADYLDFGRLLYPAMILQVSKKVLGKSPTLRLKSLNSRHQSKDLIQQNLEFNTVSEQREDRSKPEPIQQCVASYNKT